MEIFSIILFAILICIVIVSVLKIYNHFHYWKSIDSSWANTYPDLLALLNSFELRKILLLIPFISDNNLNEKELNTFYTKTKFWSKCQIVLIALFALFFFLALVFTK